jgi:tetratricopeptide (TPR) repeat protein
MKRIAMLLLLAAMLPAVRAAAQDACGDLKNFYGPFDYRTASPELKARIENFHFTPKVATLQGGQSTMDIGADIAYTLRVFPNHPRALYAMAELGRRQKLPVPIKAGLSVDCWFERALRFAPDDGQVRIVYGIELLKDGKREQAIDQLNAGIKLDPTDGNAQYNVGLAYFDLGDYDKALEHAKKAEALGYTLPGLKAKLQKAGKWK